MRRGRGRPREYNPPMALSIGDRVQIIGGYHYVGCTGVVIARDPSNATLVTRVKLQVDGVRRGRRSVGRWFQTRWIVLVRPGEANIRLRKKHEYERIKKEKSRRETVAPKISTSGREEEYYAPFYDPPFHWEGPD